MQGGKHTFIIALSPSGKAQDFDSCIRWFESIKGSGNNEQINKEIIMSVEVGTFLIVLCSVLTGLITEAWKNMTGAGKTKPNIVAAVISVITAVLVCVAYIILTEAVLDAKLAVYCVGLIGTSWLCAMVGYDKVMQTLKQLFK